MSGSNDDMTSKEPDPAPDLSRELILQDCFFGNTESVLANVTSFDEDNLPIAVKTFNKFTLIDKYWDESIFNHLLGRALPPRIVKGLFILSDVLQSGRVVCSDFIITLSGIASGPLPHRIMNFTYIWDTSGKGYLTTEEVIQLYEDCEIPENCRTLTTEGEAVTASDVGIWAMSNPDVSFAISRVIFLLVHVLLEMPLLQSNVELYPHFSEYFKYIVEHVNPENFDNWVILSRRSYALMLDSTDVITKEDTEADLCIEKTFVLKHSQSKSVCVLKRNLRYKEDFFAIPLRLFQMTMGNRSEEFIKRSTSQLSAIAPDFQFPDDWYSPKPTNSYFFDLYPPILSFIRRTSSKDYVIFALIVVPRCTSIYEYFAKTQKTEQLMLSYRFRLIMCDGEHREDIVGKHQTAADVGCITEGTILIEERSSTRDNWPVYHPFGSSDDEEMTDVEANNETDEKLPTGLANKGFTCYLNSVVQCLGNLEFSKKFFTKETTLALEKLGIQTKTDLHNALADVFAVLWEKKRRYLDPTNFCHVFLKRTSDFPMYEQHDASEALNCILELLHDDLRIQINENLENDVSEIRSPEDSWKIQRYKNGVSPISYFCEGVVISELICGSCHYNSPTFEPFLIHNLPLDNVTELEIKFIIVNEENTQYEVRYQYIPPMMTLEQFLNGVARELSFSTEKLFFYCSNRKCNLLYQDNVNRDFLISKYFINGKQDKPFVVYKLPVSASSENVNPGFSMCFQFLVRENHKNGAFGLSSAGYPILKYFPRGISRAGIYDAVFQVFKNMKSLFTNAKEKHRSQALHDKEKDEYPFYLIHLDSDGQNCPFLHHQQTCYGCIIPIDNALFDFSVSPNIGILWKVIPFCLFYRNIISVLHTRNEKEFAKVLSRPLNTHISLRDCLTKTMYPEHLDDPIDCGRCKTKCYMTKSMKLFLAPSVFIINLKRFTPRNYGYVKDSRPVTFPLENFDIRPYMHDTAPTSGQYKCSGFIEHTGGMGSGHYVAYIRQNEKWYCLNDDSCTVVDPSLLKTDDAVLIFYELMSDGSVPLSTHPFSDVLKKEAEIITLIENSRF